MSKNKKPIITLEGVKLRIESPDIDGDGETGGVETVRMDTGTQPIYQESELGESMKELNNDAMNNEGMSNIDFNSRLHKVEEPSITAWEVLCSTGIVPQRWERLTRKKKRNVVSVQGLGRKEKVELVVGKREHDQKMGGFGMGATVKNLMGMGDKEAK